MKNKSKLALFAAVVLQALLLIMPVSAAAAGDDQEIGETYNNQMYQTEGKVDSAVLAPTGDRLYTLNDGVLRQYNLSPLGRISAMKMAFDTRQPKEDPYKTFITKDEKRLIIYSKTQLRLLDLKSGKIIKTVAFQSEVGVLNDGELFTLDNDNKATVWNAYELTRKKEFVAAGDEQWSNKNYDIAVITRYALIKAANHIILYRSADVGKVFVFDATSYRQIWNLVYLDYPGPTFSYDLRTLYIGNSYRKIWHPEKFIDHIAEFRQKNKEAPIGAVLKIDIATAQVEYLNKQDFKLSQMYRSIPLGQTWEERQISPTQQYYLSRYSFGHYVFFYRDKAREKHIKSFLQFESGEVAFISNAGYFQGTEHARKHLKMKNNKGELVPINDATFEKFNKTINDHKEW